MWKKLKKSIAPFYLRRSQMKVSVSIFRIIPKMFNYRISTIFLNFRCSHCRFLRTFEVADPKHADIMYTFIHNIRHTTKS